VNSLRTQNLDARAGTGRLPERIVQLGARVDDMQTINWVDRGQNLTIDIEGDITRGCIGVSRMSSIQVGCGAFTLWLQVRGSSRVASSEGRFHLHAGHWIVLDRHSQPRLQADRHSLCIGVALHGTALELLNADACRLYPGWGAMARYDLQIAGRRAKGARTAPATPARRRTYSPTSPTPA
jgi:AraC family transcriptional regulator